MTMLRLAAFTLLLVAYTEATTPPPAPTSSVTRCDGSGFRVTITGITTSYYAGHPYAQNDYTDSICGVNGTAWTSNAADTEFNFTVTLDEMQNSDCGTFSDTTNATSNFYKTFLVVPRRTDKVELDTDHGISAKCTWSDTITVSPDMATIGDLQKLSVKSETVSDAVDGPTISAQILDSTNSVPSAAITLGESLKLRVQYTDDKGGIWNRIAIITFTATQTTGAGASTFQIIQGGCLTSDADDISATYTTNVPPVDVGFKAFRFSQDELVGYSIRVRACNSNTSSECTISCSRRKRAALWSLEDGSRQERSADTELSSDSAAEQTADNSGMVEMDFTLYAMVTTPENLPDVEQLQVEGNVDYAYDYGVDDNMYLARERGMKVKAVVPHDEISLSDPTMHDDDAAVCLDVTQLAVVCSLVFLILLATTVAAAYSCCKIWMFRQRHQDKYEKMALAHNSPIHKRKDGIHYDSLASQCCTCSTSTPTVSSQSMRCA